MEINKRAHGHGHGESSETTQNDCPEIFHGDGEGSADGKGGPYVLGHIRWVNWPPYPHLPMWAPDTETVLKLCSVLWLLP